MSNDNKTQAAPKSSPADVSLADVVDRLDRIAAALEGLSAAVASGASAPVAAPALRSSGAPEPVRVRPMTGPAPIRVAPPARPQAAPPIREAASAEAPEEDPYADRADMAVPGHAAGLREVLARVFQAALFENAEDTWALMTRLTHSSQLRGPRSLEHFKAFSWNKARRTVIDYLDAERNPDSFLIDYTDPAVVDDSTERVKVFIRVSDGRLPVPILMARDAKSGGAWRVASMSL